MNGELPEREEPTRFVPLGHLHHLRPSPVYASVSMHIHTSIVPRSALKIVLPWNHHPTQGRKSLSLNVHRSVTKVY